MNIFDFKERPDVRVDETIERLAHAVIGAAIEVHRELGPGLPEVVYRASLSIELTSRGIRHECEVPIPVFYKGQLVGEGRVDVLVEDKLVLELKVVEALNTTHRAQVISYLKVMKLPLALLINFNVAILRDGLKRVINSSD